jgi:hypothetical protein
MKNSLKKNTLSTQYTTAYPQIAPELLCLLLLIIRRFLVLALLLQNTFLLALVFLFFLAGHRRLGFHATSIPALGSDSCNVCQVICI